VLCDRVSDYFIDVESKFREKIRKARARAIFLNVPAWVDWVVNDHTSNVWNLIGIISAAKEVMKTFCTSPDISY
jgi:hypothetical protein